MILDANLFHIGRLDINVSINEKHKELESEGNTPPICLFSKVKKPAKNSELMLECLETDKIELACVDVDKSGSTA